jgi:RNA polymerase sigma factor (sigma-70 family)
VVDAQALFAQYHEPLCRYLLRYTGDADLAADLAQETFVRLLERPPDMGHAGPWLFRVATNLARDASRARTRRRFLLLGAWNRLPHGDAPPSPDRGVEGEERRRALEEALQALNPKERMALLMREEGFTQREIAVAVGTTTKSVGTLIARAIRKLAPRIHLAPEDL